MVNGRMIGAWVVRFQSAQNTRVLSPKTIRTLYIFPQPLALSTTRLDCLGLCLSLGMPLAFTQVRSLALVVVKVLRSGVAKAVIQSCSHAAWKLDQLNIGE